MSSRLHTHWQLAQTRLAPSMRRARQKYHALAPRERRLVCAATALATCVLVYAVLLEPAAKTISTLQRQLPELRAQTATVTALSAQAMAQRRSSRNTQPTLPERDELAASLVAAGLASPQWSIETPSSSAAGSTPSPLTITLKAAPASAVLRWIDAIAFDWGLTIKELDLTRAVNAGGRPLPGLVNGTLVLNVTPPDSAKKGASGPPLTTTTR